jgi:hypothetical protein
MSRELLRKIALGGASLFLVVSLFACSSRYGYYQDRDHNGYYNSYGSERQAYEAGYKRGYDHGWSDRRSGYRFNYEDDQLFRSGISRDGDLNDRFRQAYVRGYETGYYRYRY